MADDSENEVPKTPAQLFEEYLPDPEIRELAENYCCSIP
jgi:hypothetical protein